MSGFPLSRRPMLTAIASAALLLSSAAWADGPFPGNLNEADQHAFAAHDQRLKQTVDHVLAHANDADSKALDGAIRPAASSLPAEKMVGKWRCRSIQLSEADDLPIVVYRDFQCRITDDGAGLQLTKLTGSQRPAGTFYDMGENRLGFAGALALGDERKAPRYGQQADRNQVGYLVPMSARHMRLELQQASRPGAFEVLELRR